MPDELWKEVHDIVQEAVTTTIPKKKKCKKAKWLSEEALQIAEKRKVKSKGETERYNQLNTKFQRITREDKTLRGLGSITTAKVGGDGIPTDLFHILKDDAVTVLYSICQ